MTLKFDKLSNKSEKKIIKLPCEIGSHLVKFLFFVCCFRSAKRKVSCKSSLKKECKRQEFQAHLTATAIFFAN